MKQIENYIDELVLKIKEDDSLSQYCFVKGFSAREFPDPLVGYIIAVSTLDTQVGVEFLSQAVGENLCGSMYNMTLKFRVYAPKNEGGEGLLALAHTLCETLRKNDSENVIQNITTSSISFDNDAMTVYRDVVAELSFCLYEEVTA
ncbi:MAG: hypothetical protein E7513_05985 [Ruminococcaceae bacterium]|nr:hypothetical protein [Oscillospiraceae bacterium]